MLALAPTARAGLGLMPSPQRLLGHPHVDAVLVCHVEHRTCEFAAGLCWRLRDLRQSAGLEIASTIGTGLSVYFPEGVVQPIAVQLAASRRQVMEVVVGFHERGVDAPFRAAPPALERGPVALHAQRVSLAPAAVVLADPRRRHDVLPFQSVGAFFVLPRRHAAGVAIKVPTRAPFQVVGTTAVHGDLMSDCLVDVGGEPLRRGEGRGGLCRRGDAVSD